MKWDSETVPMDYPLPQSNWIPSGRFDEDGKPLYYTRPWTPEELILARQQHRKQRRGQ